MPKTFHTLLMRYAVGVVHSILQAIPHPLTLTIIPTGFKASFYRPDALPVFLSPK